MPASAVLARPRHPAAPQTGSFLPRDQRRYPQGPIRRTQGLHHGVLGAWDGVRPTRVPWGSLGCARASQPGRGAGPGGAVSPRTAPHSCGGQWSRPAFRRACHGQRVPGTPFTTRASWDLGLKGSGQLPWPCMVQMLTWERSRGGPEWRGRDPAGRGGRAALPDSHPGRVQTLLDWVSGWLGSPRLLCLCTPSHRPSGSGLHCRLHSGRGGGEIGVQLRETRAAPLVSRPRCLRAKGGSLPAGNASRMLRKAEVKPL